MKNKFYDIVFSKKTYGALEALQIDVDHCISKYNQQRPHSGKYCYGKTPMQTFREAAHLALEKTIPGAELADMHGNKTVAV